VIQQAEAAGVDTIEGVVAQGAPHRAILDYVDEQDIDLIVMGTHGRTGLDRYLLGSVTEKVVRLSDAPVLTVRMPAESADESS
jgi:nucleotide-binding universal stress UspA family protein